MTSDKDRATEARLNALLTGQPWNTASMQHGWTGTLSYRLTMDQRSVKLRASGLTPGTTANGTVIASLPAGFRPMANAVLTASSDNLASQAPHVTVMSSGDIQCFGVGAATYFAIEAEFAIDV